MPRKQNNIHYIYKTTCNVTSRYYIGMHSTNNLNDGYIGSGTRLRRSIRKYGKENHIKEILEYVETRKLLIEREKEIVTSELIQDDLCMNLKCGGEGGLSSEEHRTKFLEVGLKNLEKSRKIGLKKIFELRNDPERVENYGRKVSDGLVKYYETNSNSFKGRKHSIETKLQLSKMKKGNGIAEANSQFGTMWITNGIENRKVKKDSNIPVEWYKGRV
jgi:hypothetical protein